MKGTFLLYAYLLLSAVHLYAAHTQLTWLMLVSKPLLVSLLAVWFWRNTSAHLLARLLLAGLIFSVGGDTLLTLVEHGPQKESFFLLGLASFLMAQLCYAMAFLRYPGVRAGLLIRQPWWMLPFLFYLFGMLFFLLPHISAPLQIPVSVYASAIMLMATAAAHLQGRTSAALYWGLLSGVLLFVVSDTLIAVNKFVDPLLYARLLIMGTYLGAQFLIVWNFRGLLATLSDPAG